MTTETQTQTHFNSWLWPDQTLGKRASGALREEHNALVNAYADAQAHADKLAEALRAALVAIDCGKHAKRINKSNPRTVEAMRAALAAYEESR